MKKITVKNTDITILKVKEDDYISLTDMAKSRDVVRTDYILQNWMRNRSTIEFLGLWEIFNNPRFNSIEFDGFKNMSGSNSFSLTPQRWIESTNAIGIIAKRGRYGGTYAHNVIAFEFATWLSSEFKFYMINEYLHYKAKEQEELGWTAKRELARINYHIHTSAISRNLIPPKLTRNQINYIYASESDVLNMALFGITEKEWREQNPNLQGNIRDYAEINQLICLSNLENINSVLINDGIPQNDRLEKLNQIAIQQMQILEGTSMKVLQ